MRIIVDADACPVKSILLEISRKYELDLVFVLSLCHYTDFYENNQIDLVLVDNVSQSADMVIINSVDEGDLVVTGDYGLAALVLAKDACAISFDGKIFTKENIDNILHKRHISMEIIRRGGRLKGPKKRKKEDDDRFRSSIETLIRRI